MPTEPTNPDPDQLVLLTTARTEFEGRAIAGAVEGEGIPVEVFATAATMVQWDGGYANTVKVMVRRADVSAAQAALARVRQASVDLDWDGVDVGSPEDDHNASSPRRTSRRTGGFSPALWRVRMIGTGLLTAIFALWALGDRFAIPAAIIAVLLTISAFTGRTPRSRTR